MGDIPPRRFGRRYPWDQWFGSGQFVLRRGQDYDIMTHAMAQMVRNVACRRRISVSVNILDDETVEVAVNGKQRGTTGGDWRCGSTGHIKSR